MITNHFGRIIAHITYQVNRYIEKILEAGVKFGSNEFACGGN